MGLTSTGRYVIGAAALLVAGFALGSLSGVQLAVEPALGMLSGAVVLLLLATRQGGRDDGAL